MRGGGLTAIGVLARHLDGQGLAGERRLVDLERLLVRVQPDRVRGHDVAAAQEDDVSGHNLGHVQRHPGAVALDRELVQACTHQAVACIHQVVPEARDGVVLEGRDGRLCARGAPARSVHRPSGSVRRDGSVACVAARRAWAFISSIKPRVALVTSRAKIIQKSRYDPRERASRPAISICVRGRR